MTDNKTSATAVTAIFAVIVYMYLLAALISWWLFLVPNSCLPSAVVAVKVYSMELAQASSSIMEASAYNIGAIFTFGFFHSLLARKTVKKWMNLPVALERNFFCLQAAFFLHMIQHFWKEVDGYVVWDATNSPKIKMISVGIFFFGVAYILSATFALDHFHLFRLTQGFGVDINKALGLAVTNTHKEEGGLATRWHYNHVAHPIMTGMLITFWATPIMSSSRLLCAAFMTLYVLIAVIHFEERTIRDELGSDYDKYLSKTPRFCPNVMAMLLGSPVPDLKKIMA